MRDLRIRILSFRGLLEQTIQAQLGRRDKYSQGVVAVTRALLTDFDNIFSPSVLKDKEDKIHPLIEKFCHKNGCPICGAKTERKSGKFGVFIGCSKYPDCKGVRRADGSVSINDALRFYLTKKLYEERLKDDSAESRFQNLDL